MMSRCHLDICHSASRLGIVRRNTGMLDLTLDSTNILVLAPLVVGRCHLNPTPSPTTGHIVSNLCSSATTTTGCISRRAQAQQQRPVTPQANLASDSTLFVAACSMRAAHRPKYYQQSRLVALGCWRRRAILLMLHDVSTTMHGACHPARCLPRRARRGISTLHGARYHATCHLYCTIHVTLHGEGHVAPRWVPCSALVALCGHAAQR